MLIALLETMNAYIKIKLNKKNFIKNRFQVLCLILIKMDFQKNLILFEFLIIYNLKYGRYNKFLNQQILKMKEK